MKRWEVFTELMVACAIVLAVMRDGLVLAAFVMAAIGFVKMVEARK